MLLLEAKIRQRIAGNIFVVFVMMQLRRKRAVCLVSYPDPSAILYRARWKGSGNIGVQFLYLGGGVTDA